MALGGGLGGILGGRGLAPMAMSSGGMRNGAGGAPTASAPSLPRQEPDGANGQDMAKLGGMLAMLQNKSNAPTNQMGPADQEIARMQAAGVNPSSMPGQGAGNMPTAQPPVVSTQGNGNASPLPGLPPLPGMDGGQGGGMPMLPGMGGGQGGQQGGGMQFDPQQAMSMMQMFSQFFGG